MNELDYLSNAIEDEDMPELLKLTSEINVNESRIRSQAASKCLSVLHNDQLLESIVQILPRLSELIEGRFDEAIHLLDQVADLNDKYGAQIPIIDHVFRESEKLRIKLISNLSKRLDQLAECNIDEVSSVIRQLFRCGNFTNRSLKLKYLQARDNWFNNKCEASGSSFDDVVNVHYDGLPMIWKEYKSIFSSQDSSISDKSIGLMNGDPMAEDGAIINSWLLMKTSIFISSLEVYLESIHQSGNQTPTMLGDTIQRCFELSDKLASIGFDFSTRLRPLVLEAISVEVKASIDKATERFETHFTAVVSKSIETLLLPVEDEILRISNMRPDEKLPESIEHYPVFRIYCLHVMNSLRWLHICRDFVSPVSLCLNTYDALNTSMVRVTKALATILNLDSNTRHPILTKIAISYITEVLPFFAKYCETLFPERVILSSIGLSKADYKSLFANEPDQLRGIRLNHKQIAEPLRSTMPRLLQTIE